jgi:lipoyl(octanoyl) transferase
VGEGKIASIGLHLSRGVTMHGLALNLVNSLEGFRLVVPCGITNVRIVALSDLIAGAPTPSEAWPGLAAEVAKSFAHAVATLDTGGCRE